MYVKGDASVTVYNKKHYEYTRDANGHILYKDIDGTKLLPVVTDNPREKWQIQIDLPHSCDEWVIGGPEEARLMILDLEAAIVRFNDIKEGRDNDDGVST